MCSKRVVSPRLRTPLWSDAGRRRCGAGLRYGRAVQEYAPLLLFAVAGFLLGGVYALWKTTKLMAGILAVAAVLAAAGGVLWLL